MAQECEQYAEQPGTSRTVSVIHHNTQQTNKQYDTTTTIILAARFHDNLGKPVRDCQSILQFTASRHDEGSGGANQNYKTCKTRVKSPSPIYRHSSCCIDQMSFLSPNQVNNSVK